MTPSLSAGHKQAYLDWLRGGSTAAVPPAPPPRRVTLKGLALAGVIAWQLNSLLWTGMMLVGNSCRMRDGPCSLP